MLKITDQYDFVLIANSYSKLFSKKVAHYLDHHKDKLNFKLDSISDKFFPDGSRFTQLAGSVRGNRVFVIHNYLLNFPDQTNYDLFLISDALKRANEEGFILCPTYFNSRGDKKDDGRVPIPAKLYANLLETSGGKNLMRVMTCHLHAKQEMGFFDIPVDDVPSLPLFCWYIKRRLFKKYFESNTEKDNLAILAPDGGAFKLAKQAAEFLSVPVATRMKEREKFKNTQGDIKMQNIDASFDMKDRHILIFDDMLDTGGTMIEASNDLVEKYGAKSVYCFITHFLGSPKEKTNSPTTAEDKFAKANSKIKLITTDTIQRSDEYIKKNSSWLCAVLSMAPFLGETIYRQCKAISVSVLYDNPELFESLLDKCFAEDTFDYYNRENKNLLPE